jgi:WD40 repeat protein
MTSHQTLRLSDVASVSSLRCVARDESSPPSVIVANGICPQFKAWQAGDLAFELKLNCTAAHNPEHALNERTGYISAMHDGMLIAADTYRFAKLRVFSTDTWKQIQLLDTCDGGSSTVSCLHFDGTMILIGTVEGKVKGFRRDAEGANSFTRHLRGTTLRAHEGEIKTVHCTAANFIACYRRCENVHSGSFHYGQQTIAVWSIADGALLSSIDCTSHAPLLTSFVLSPDPGRLLVLQHGEDAYMDGAERVSLPADSYTHARCLNLSSPKPTEAPARLHKGRACSWDYDNNILVVGFADGMSIVCGIDSLSEPCTPQVVASQTGQHGGAVGAVQLLRTDNATPHQFVSACADCCVRLWDFTSHEQCACLFAVSIGAQVTSLWANQQFFVCGTNLGGVEVHALLSPGASTEPEVQGVETEIAGYDFGFETGHKVRGRAADHKRAFGS